MRKLLIRMAPIAVLGTCFSLPYTASAQIFIFDDSPGGVKTITPDVDGELSPSLTSGTPSGNILKVLNVRNGVSNVSGGSTFSHAGNTPASDNRVEVINSSVERVVGGLAPEGDVTGNSVLIGSGSKVSDSVYGGIGSGRIANNIVTIDSGSTVERLVLGGFSDSEGGEITGNIVRVLNGSTVGIVNGGFSETGGNNVMSNRVFIMDSTVTGYISGGFVAKADTGNATDNSVVLSNAIVTGDAIGGGAVIDATGNTVSVAHSSVANIFAGLSRKGNATGNTVNIHEGVTLGASGGIFGGMTDPGGMGDVFSGNTLNLYSKLTLAAGQTIGNFETYNFHISADVRPGDVILTVDAANPVDLSNGLTGAGQKFSDVRVVSFAAQSHFNLGDKITLINHVVNANPHGFGGSITAEKGIFELVDLTTGLAPGTAGAPGAMTATIDGVRVNQKGGGVAAGYNAAFLSTLDATLLAASEGMSALLSQTPQQGRFVPFVSVNYRSIKHDQKQRIDLNGDTAIAGIGTSFETGRGRVSIAGFYEFGEQNYETDLNTVTGRGDVDYTGGGLMVRFDSGLYYVEGLVSTGKKDTSYYTNTFAAPVQYDISPNYLSGYLGAGLNYPVNSRVQFGVNGKYVYNKLDGETVQLSTGDRVEFGKTKASTFGAGSSLSYRLDNGFMPYANLGVEYTRGTETHVQGNGKRVNAADIDGTTGNVRLGLRYEKPGSSWGADFGVTGYAGVRRGYSAGAGIKVVF